MKRIITVSVALIALTFVSDAYSAKVTIKRGAKTENVELNKEEYAANVDKNFAGKSASVVPSETINTEDTKVTRKKENVNTVVKSEDLTEIPRSPLLPMTDAERDAKYPIVPQALRMTLEELTPTKELRNIRVLKAMARIPREEFVPKDYRAYAYQDAAVPIGESQTISPPFIVAYMTEALDPQPTDRVLEIGTGSGYQAAVLSCLVAEVYSIEIVKNLGRRASETLKRLGYDNVFVRLGDGYQGWNEAAPFDKIIVTCSPEDVPQPLIDQLKDGGKMLIPIGERYRQYFVLCEKKEGKLIKTTLTPASFVPMTGEAEDKRIDKPDPTTPSLIGGGFEIVNPTPGELTPTATWKTDRLANSESDNENDDQKIDETNIQLPPPRLTPEGWFSTRNTFVADREDAYEGGKVCVCDNASVVDEQQKKIRNAERFKAATLPENRREATPLELEVKEKQREQEAVCHLRQNFAIDGTEVKKIVLSGAYRIEKLRPNVGDRQTVTLIKLYFFDRERKPVKNGEFIVLTAYADSCDWNEFSQEIAVPSRAFEASLQVGILDGVGVVEFDGLALKNKNEKKTSGRR